MTTLLETNDVQSNSAVERRRNERFPIRCKIVITPINQKGVVLSEESVTAIGKDISQNGIGFTHDFAIKYRRFLLSFHASGFGEFFVEAEVARTRTTAIGLHETGCRMVRKIVAPTGFVQ